VTGNVRIIDEDDEPQPEPATPLPTDIPPIPARPDPLTDKDFKLPPAEDGGLPPLMKEAFRADGLSGSFVADAMEAYQQPKVVVIGVRPELLDGPPEWADDTDAKLETFNDHHDEEEKKKGTHWWQRR
jgi:hypothetical protein